MKMIGKKIYSHKSIYGNEKYRLNEIRISEPLVVSNYRLLVEHVARIAYNNRDYSVYFRGQDIEYYWPNNRTMILPSIYRDLDKNINKHDIICNRMEILERAGSDLLSTLSTIPGQHDETFKEFKEIRWAILQHYRVCRTPLIDLTTSLRAACSFALNNNRESGILYLIGLPNIHGSISFYVEEKISILKLLCICPPIALRPHFQDGYLVGTFPIDYKCEHMSEYDISKRLLAKFKLINENGGFWTDDFMCIPDNALYPDDNDQVFSICENIKRRVIE